MSGCERRGDSPSPNVWGFVCIRTGQKVTWGTIQLVDRLNLQSNKTQSKGHCPEKGMIQTNIRGSLFWERLCNNCRKVFNHFIEVRNIWTLFRNGKQFEIHSVTIQTQILTVSKKLRHFWTSRCSDWKQSFWISYIYLYPVLPIQQCEHILTESHMKCLFCCSNVFFSR